LGQIRILQPWQIWHKTGVAMADVQRGAQYLKDEAYVAFHDFAKKIIARIEGL